MDYEMQAAQQNGPGEDPDAKQARIAKELMDMYRTDLSIVAAFDKAEREANGQ